MTKPMTKHSFVDGIPYQYKEKTIKIIERLRATASEFGLGTRHIMADYYSEKDGVRRKALVIRWFGMHGIIIGISVEGDIFEMMDTNSLINRTSEMARSQFRKFVDENAKLFDKHINGLRKDNDAVIELLELIIIGATGNRSLEWDYLVAHSYNAILDKYRVDSRTKVRYSPHETYVESILREHNPYSGVTFSELQGRLVEPAPFYLHETAECRLENLRVGVAGLGYDDAKSWGERIRSHEVSVYAGKSAHTNTLYVHNATYRQQLESGIRLGTELGAVPDYIAAWPRTFQLGKRHSWDLDDLICDLMWTE